MIPRERAELVRNTDYWDKTRVPKIDRMVLLPIPDAVNRTSAMLAGQVDWVEAPAPDLVPKLKAAGIQIVTNSYPHTWPYWLSRLDDSPFLDIRVRKAMNLAIDATAWSRCSAVLQRRVASLRPPPLGSANRPSRSNMIRRKPRGCWRAGYSVSKPVKVKALISASGRARCSRCR